MSCPVTRPQDKPDGAVLLNEDMARKFRSIIASLLYIALKNRQDIIRAATIVGSYVSGRERKHYTAARIVLRYLQETDHYI